MRFLLQGVGQIRNCKTITQLGPKTSVVLFGLGSWSCENVLAFLHIGHFGGSWRERAGSTSLSFVKAFTGADSAL